MKSKLTIISFFLFFGYALAETEKVILTEDEITSLKRDSKLIQKATNTGDVDYLINCMYPKIFDFFGGREKFISITKSSIQKMLDSGVKFESVVIGEPTEAYTFEDGEICFVPKESIIRLGKKRVHSQSYLVAIRNRDTKSWTFIEGSAFRQNLDLLWMIFPELPKSARLPVNEKKIID